MFDISLPIIILFFFTEEHPLKTSNKRTHISLLINRFVFFNCTKDVTIDKLLN